MSISSLFSTRIDVDTEDATVEDEAAIVEGSSNKSRACLACIGERLGLVYVRTVDCRREKVHVHWNVFTLQLSPFHYIITKLGVK